MSLTIMMLYVYVYMFPPLSLSLSLSTLSYTLALSLSLIVTKFDSFFLFQIFYWFVLFFLYFFVHCPNLYLQKKEKKKWKSSLFLLNSQSVLWFVDSHDFKMGWLVQVGLSKPFDQNLSNRSVIFHLNNLANKNW